MRRVTSIFSDPIQDEEQVEPQPVQEVPVCGDRISDIQRRSMRRGSWCLSQGKNQGADAPGQMKAMGAGQQIEKRTVGVGSHEYPGCGELPPCHKLAAPERQLVAWGQLAPSRGIMAQIRKGHG